MTLQTMLQSAARRLGVPVPSSFTGTTDEETKFLLEIAQEEGRALARRCDWQVLIKEQTFTTVADDEQTGAIPSDYDRMIGESMFNRTRNRPVWGPIDPVEWQEYKATLVTRVDPAFRIRGNDILITPTPAAGETVAFEYVSKNWCKSSGGTEQDAWEADTDIGLLDEEAMRLGIVFRWRKARGLEFATAERDYERRVVDLMMRDGVKPRLSAEPGRTARIPYPPQVPDTLVFS